MAGERQEEKRGGIHQPATPEKKARLPQKQARRGHFKRVSVLRRRRVHVEVL
jgi:hypothetical protein